MPHATFTTPSGTCAIAWNDSGLTRFLLPDPDRHRPGTDTEADPPRWVHEIIARVQRHLAGDLQDFSDVRFDFGRMPEFERAVLRANRLLTDDPENAGESRSGSDRVLIVPPLTVWYRVRPGPRAVVFNVRSARPRP